MSECRAVTESMPLLLTESLDPVRRELTHQHIEGCMLCTEEWEAYRDTWAVLEAVPDVEPPAHLKGRFLAQVRGEQREHDTVVPFRRRPAAKWLAQAAAVVLLAGGGWFAGHQSSPVVRVAPNDDVKVERAGAIQNVSMPIAPLAIAESRTVNADAISPDIQGRPDISNVQFADADPSDNKIAVSFDMSSRWTVTGSPTDKSMVRLLSYVLENEGSATPRSSTIEWVRKTYSDPAYADPEIANALAKVLRNDAHEGVRIRAVDTLKTLPPAVASQSREALIEALKSDPNPAVRMKAIEALAAMARSGAPFDSATVDTLRAKASQDDENMYVRVKAAEALGSIHP
ncbi:MAG TPA: HEAT repeat domain-containing protein [Thermoanaerobaculia bacterium]|nr:HEAT repeat domain-containing protein [Thermoanaerobaculia bacterium]